MDDGSRRVFCVMQKQRRQPTQKLLASKISGHKRPCEAGFLFATFSLPAQRKSRRKN